MRKRGKNLEERAITPEEEKMLIDKLPPMVPPPDKQQLDRLIASTCEHELGFTPRFSRECAHCKNIKSCSKSLATTNGNCIYFCVDCDRTLPFMEKQKYCSELEAFITKDSGERQEFPSSMRRDTQKDKSPSMIFVNLILQNNANPVSFSFTLDTTRLPRKINIIDGPHNAILMISSGEENKNG